jgi:SAM-dependent methyltransferase
VIDLGCGYGRLALEVAARRPDCSVVGIDLAPPSIKVATAYAEQRGLTNCQFFERDLATYLPEVDSESADLVLFVEVSFFGARDLDVLHILLGSSGRTDTYSVRFAANGSISCIPSLCGTSKVPAWFEISGTAGSGEVGIGFGGKRARTLSESLPRLD